MRYPQVAAFLGLSTLWGSEWILTASVPAQPRLRALALQYAISAVLLLPWAIHRRMWRRPIGSIVNVVIVGINILCFPQILIFISEGRLSPIFSLAALATVPVFLAISGRLEISPAVCGFAGILFLTEHELTLSIRQLPWLLFPVSAACVLSWSLADAEKAMREISLAEALFGQCTISALLLFVASQLLKHEPITWSATAAVGFIVNACLMILCGYLLFYWLLDKSGAGRVSLLQWAQPFVTAVESSILMRIRPDWSAITGAILIVIAIVWVFSNRDDRGVLFEITQS